MRQVIPILLILSLLAGCSPNSAPTSTPSGDSGPEARVDELKTRMNDAFAGLEMYSVDNSMSYPDSLQVLVPKYLDAIPVDPLSEKPINYRKTEEGFLLEATGHYSGAGAEAGFPKMNQDGFYVMKEAEFPKDDDLPDSPLTE